MLTDSSGFNLEPDSPGKEPLPTMNVLACLLYHAGFDVAAEDVTTVNGRKANGMACYLTSLIDVAAEL